MAKLASKLANMTFSLAGKQRPNKPNAAVLDAIQGAVTNSLGPGYSVNVYSGQENAGHRHGSNRHGTGLAADVHIVGPDGKTLNARDNKQEMMAVAQSFKELGGIGIGLGTDYMGGNGIHLDMVEAGPGQDNAWGNIGNANQAMLDGLYRSPIQAALPEAMQAPLSLAQTQMRDEAIRANPLSAMPVGLSRPAPQSRQSPPSSFPSRPSFPGSMPAAPSTFRPETLDRGITGANPPSLAARPPSNAAPRAAVDSMLSGPLGLAPGTNALAASMARNVAPPVDRSVAPANPGQLGGITMSNPVGNFSVPQPATPPAHPISVPTPIHATLPAQPNVVAPLVQRPPVQDMKVASLPAAPQAPPATAYDVYSGLATEAKDNTGKNTVGMLPDGTSTVTNQWGVTTGMTPYGKQTAVGNLPSIPGISGPVARTAAKMAMPAIGSMALGPVGGILGALASYGLSRPGGLLSNLSKIDTSAVAASGLIPGITQNVTAFAKPNYGLNSFPGAHNNSWIDKNGKTVSGIRSATFSNRSAEGMRSMSPRAAADISAGRGGLF